MLILLLNYSKLVFFENLDSSEFSEFVIDIFANL